MKETYFIIRGGRAICGSSINSPCKTLEDVKEMLGYNPVYDILMEGDMYWVLGRVKGMKSPYGEITPYPGYGYDHVMMYQLKFEDGAYGICIYDTQTKEFIEEPDEYDEYGLTPEEVERKYNFKH